MLVLKKTMLPAQILFSVFISIEMAKVLHTLDKICLYFSVTFCLKQLYGEILFMKCFNFIFFFSLSRPIYNFLFKLNGRNATELLSQHQLHSVIFGKFLVLKHIRVHNTFSVHQMGSIKASEVRCSSESRKKHSSVSVSLRSATIACLKSFCYR